MRAPEFWQRRGPLATLLSPLGQLYGATVARKARHALPYRAKAKVICVGNLTAGGSGKTPVVMALAALLAARGKNIIFLTRGYGGRERGPLKVEAWHTATRVGDEALLLARVAPTIVARNRAEGAALADRMAADIILMDDGHQNFTLAKDLSLVVVDGDSGFGNGLMIPAGPLREPVAQGLARADAVVVMNGSLQKIDGARAAKLSAELSDFSGPILRARLAPEPANLRGRKLFAFAGIGRPEKFLTSLKEAGVTVTGSRFFADHHPYSEAELAALKARGELVTTAKDFVRLTPQQRQGIAVLDVAVLFADDPAPLLDRLGPGG